MDTGLFRRFTENASNEEIKYFNNKINLHELGIMSNQEKNIEIEKEYVINPEFLHLTKNNENININSLLKELIEKYPEENNKQFSFISENIIKIEEKNYNEKNCQLYFTPEESDLDKAPNPLIDLDPKAEKQIKNKNSGILKNIKENNLKKKDNKVKKEKILSDKDKDNIKESIKDYVLKILKSEEIQLTRKEKTDLLNKLNLPIGREYFISLLSKNSSNIILLKDNSFNLLWILIYSSLINT